MSDAPFYFDRYVNNVLMADGVCVERATTLSQAMTVAARIAPNGRNGETPVLIYRPNRLDLITRAEAEADAMVLAERLVDWMDRNEFRLSQIQGFGYGEDRLLFTVRDCWKAHDQVIWQKQSAADTRDADHAEMMRQIKIYRMTLAIRAGKDKT